METIKIRVKKLDPEALIPEYAHGPSEDAGMDLCALEDVIIPGQSTVTTLVRTGLAFELPAGVEMQIRPRSGLSNKRGLIIPNSPGTVDPGYRGEVLVGFACIYPQGYQIKKGDRIAQIVFSNYVAADLIRVEELSDSARGIGGFGSTGGKSL